MAPESSRSGYGIARGEGVLDVVTGCLFREQHSRWWSDRVAPMPTETPSTDHEILRRIKGEFLEMPGMQLTLGQAQRLWGLHRESCHALLEDLVHQRFLVRTRDGSFARYDSDR